MLTGKLLDRLNTSPHDRLSQSAMDFVKKTWRRCVDQVDVAPMRAGFTAAGIAAAAGAFVAPVAPLLAAVYAVYGVALLRRVNRRRRVTRMRDLVQHELELLVGDVRAGTAATGGLSRLAAVFGARGREHADPATAAIADRLKALAVVIEHTGAPAAVLVERLASDVRARARAEATLASNTAGTRASVRMLAALPLVGPFLGAAIGADPTAILLKTPIGVICLFAAVALQALGLLWSNRIRRTIEQQVLPL